MPAGRCPAALPPPFGIVANEVELVFYDHYVLSEGSVERNLTHSVRAQRRSVARRRGDRMHVEIAEDFGRQMIEESPMA